MPPVRESCNYSEHFFVIYFIIELGRDHLPRIECDGVKSPFMNLGECCS